MEEQMQSPPIPPVTPPAAERKMSGMAVAAFILAFIFPPAGLVFGIVALVQISGARGALRGNGLAIASVIIAPLMLLIAVPAAILFPVFARARGKAQEAGCMNNAKQLSMAMSMYTADWDTYYPSAGTWNVKLQPYMQSPSILHCPTDLTEGPSYAMNAALSGKRESDVTYAAETVMLFESNPGPNQAGGRELLPAPPRHDGGHVIGFADGRVMTVPPGSPIPTRWELSP